MLTKIDDLAIDSGKSKIGARIRYNTLLIFDAINGAVLDEAESRAFFPWLAAAVGLDVTALCAALQYAAINDPDERRSRVACMALCALRPDDPHAAERDYSEAMKS